MNFNTRAKLLTIFVFCIAVILIIVFFTEPKVKYPLNDCVTYFDSEARYQLVDVGNEYHILDASAGKSLCSNIKYYLYQNNELYLIYEKNIGVKNNNKISEIYYGLIDTISGEFTETNSLSDVYTKFAYNKADMIDLTKRKSSFVEWLTDFIPHKIRKK